MKLKLYFLLLISFAAHGEQIKLARMEKMSQVPSPLQVIDFKQLSLDFDRKIFDTTLNDKFWPMMWIDESEHNFKQPTFGIYTTIGDIRQGPLKHDGSYHESLATMGAVLGATLVGIDKSRQNYNYVAMLKNYFNQDSGWNILQNNTNPQAGSMGGGYGRDWWYDVYPNLLFYAVYDKYPEEKGFAQIARSVADKFYQADKSLKGNYHYSFYDYKKMKPVKNWICAQPDVAAGHSWVLYSAYKKFKQPKYLTGAKSALSALLSNKVNPSYEVLIPFGALMAARLNAEEGEDYDVKKILDWTFNGDAICRKGWGVLVGKWNNFDISGTVGSTVDHGGYGFLMNTYDMAWPLLPLVRYDQRFASTIGKWMLHAANAAKLFYPDYLARKHQTLPHLKDATKGVIGYEGIVKKSTHARYLRTTQAPVAQGDGPKWVQGNPEVTQFSVYGSAHVGIFGSIIRKTEVEGILELDLLATDFFREKAYTTYLYYNPFAKLEAIDLKLPPGNFDLYDLVSGKFVAKNVSSLYRLSLAPESAQVIVQVPVGGKITISHKKMAVDGIVVDFRFQRTNK